MHDLKERTIRGGLAKACSQAANFIIRLGSMMILGRILGPKEFGLVAMVTALIGVLNLFRDFGLSTATVQRTTISEDQLSALFWINILIGGILAAFTIAVAPFVAVFYHEPRLVHVTMAMAAGFVFNAVGVQHTALLQRRMRFTAMAVIEITSLVASTATGIGLALLGYGYWALVAMAVLSPAVYSICVWCTVPWIPEMPRRGVGIRSMVRFGGTITLNTVIIYIAYNLDKVLLGRFWGAAAVGIYGRAYQLITIPTDNLNSAVGGVTFAALSRLQNDPERFRNYFLKAYALVLATTLPITILCAAFGSDLVLVLLGAKWKEAIPIFRLLAPTILVLAVINPLGWLLFSLGLVGRSLKVVLFLSPLVIAGYFAGLPHGPQGVAFCYSLVMTLWLVPHVAYCVHGTVISLRDVWLAVSRPLLSGIVAGAIPFVLGFFYGQSLSPLVRLVLVCTLFVIIYLGMLLYVMGQKLFYMDVLQKIVGRAPVEEKAAVLV
jgi:O-antigen/teichoic acid export membrane protein